MHLPSFLRSLFRSAPTRTSPATPQAAPRFQKGQLLLGRLDGEIDVTPRGRGALIGGSRSRPLAVFTHTQAGAQAKGKDRFSPDASWVGRGVMLMSPPAKEGQVVGFAQACVQGKVTQLIDLTAPEDQPKSCMDRSTPWEVGSGRRKWSACFRAAVAPIARHLKADPNHRVETDLGKGATERRIEVALTGPDGVRKQDLAWTRWPVHPGQVLQAPLLLKVCQQVAMHAPAEDAAVAFQDASGGSIAAAFAAALAMYREHLVRPLTPRLLEDAVVQACGQLRANRSPALFAGRPDLLESLFKFGELLMNEDRKRDENEPALGSAPTTISASVANLRSALRRKGASKAASSDRVNFIHTAQAARVLGTEPTARAIDAVVDTPVQFGAKQPASRAQGEALKAARAWAENSPVQAEEGSDIASSR